MSMTIDEKYSDPRTRTDGLGWVTRAVFPGDRVRLALTAPGDRTVPPGAAARYAVVPSVQGARFLVPLGSRRVAAASVLAYNALRPVRVRVARAGIGALAGLGLDRPARMPVLTVTAPSGVDPAEALLVEHLAAALGHGRLHAAIGVRPPDPNAKPTLQLFDDGGRPRGYAKIGWNDATRALVRAEAAALRGLPREVPGHPDTPRLLLDSEWGDRALAVVAPLPRRTSRLGDRRGPQLDAMLAVARRGGPATVPLPFAGSPYLARLRRRAEGGGERIAASVEVLAATHATTAVEYGDWHGDWVPWNLGRHAGRLIAWDWEHHGSGVPVGFDLAHQAFQTALTLRDEPAAAAARTAGAALQRYGPGLGLDTAQARLVLDAYLVELWLRARRLADGGAGWNPKLHPALLDVLAALAAAR
jgi:hypothetical protein